MMKKREREAAAYVNLKPRNASMAVEVSKHTKLSTHSLFSSLLFSRCFPIHIHNLRTSFLSYLTYHNTSMFYITYIYMCV